MGDEGTVANYYAVPIGINAYPTSSLNSCVRDVQGIKEFLERKAELGTYSHVNGKQEP